MMADTDVLPRVQWKRVIGWCVASTALVTTLVAITALQRGGIEQVLFAGDTGPAAELLQEDFPTIDFLEDDPGHDGQHFYALARTLPHLHDAEPYLGFRPGYRAQRIGLPLASRLLHPWGGGGPSLVWALLVANGLGILAGAIGTSVLVTSRGGPAWAGAVFPWLPACLQGLQLTLADAFGTGVVIAALAAAHRRRPVLTGALATAALLGKEATLIIFAGWVVWALTQRLSWRRWAPFAVATVVAVGWMHVLRGIFPGPRLGGTEFVVPLTGIVDAVKATLDGAVGASWFGLGMSLGVFIGLVAVALRGDRATSWPWIAAVCALYQAVLADAFWYKTINALRFSIGGMAVLLVVIGTRFPATLSPRPGAPASDP